MKLINFSLDFHFSFYILFLLCVVKFSQLYCWEKCFVTIFLLMGHVSPHEH